jgi:uncharacterized protein (TIGR03083 family)
MGTPGLEALRNECELVSRAVLTLSEEEFERPTRCPAWNVKELLGHMYRDVDRANTGLAAPPPPGIDTDSVSYWRRYDPAPRSQDSVDVADRAKQIAGEFETGSGLADAWDQMWRTAIDRAGEEDPDRHIVTWGPVLTLEEFLKTRVLEITIHGADLADALRRAPWASEAGVRITKEILLGLLGQELPEALGWDDLTFVEKGSGRGAITNDERAILGSLADRFPLMG